MLSSYHWVCSNIRHLACITNVKRIENDTAFSDFLGQPHTYLFPALAVFLAASWPQ